MSSHMLAEGQDEHTGAEFRAVNNYNPQMGTREWWDMQRRRWRDAPSERLQAQRKRLAKHGGCPIVGKRKEGKDD